MHYLVVNSKMKLPFKKEKKEESREVVAKRLVVVKKSTKTEAVTEDVQKLVKGIADGDSG